MFHMEGIVGSLISSSISFFQIVKCTRSFFIKYGITFLNVNLLGFCWLDGLFWIRFLRLDWILLFSGQLYLRLRFRSRSSLYSQSITWILVYLRLVLFTRTTWLLLGARWLLWLSLFRRRLLLLLLCSLLTLLFVFKKVL